MATVTFRVKGTDGRTHKVKTVVPDITPVDKTKKFRTISAEFKSRYLAGKGHGIARGSGKKLDTALRHFDKYMRSREGLPSGDRVKQGHVDRFIDFLQNQPSLLSGKQLADKSVKDILSGTRKILHCYGKGHLLCETYEAKGLAVGHKDLERPIQFTPDYIERRARFQEKLETCRNKSYAVQSQLGQAFGLREAGRVESRDVIVYRDGQLYATRGAGTLLPITPRTIAMRYGQSALERLGPVYRSPGLEHLIVENEKGSRTRFLPIDSDARRTAVNRVQTYIRTNPDCHIHRKSYPDGNTTQQAERNYIRIQERYGATRDNQLSSHCDRHWEAQRLYQELLDSGMSPKEAAAEVVTQVGHNDCRKIRYYVSL